MIEAGRPFRACKGISAMHIRLRQTCNAITLLIEKNGKKRCKAYPGRLEKLKDRDSGQALPRSNIGRGSYRWILCIPGVIRCSDARKGLLVMPVTSSWTGWRMTVPCLSCSSSSLLSCSQDGSLHPLRASPRYVPLLVINPQKQH